jgi:hypothetical protein
MNSDPICGSCGKPGSEHNMGEVCPEQQGYFTAEPSNETLVAWMKKEFHSLMMMARREWRRQHGHGG